MSAEEYMEQRNEIALLQNIVQKNKFTIVAFQQTLPNCEATNCTPHCMEQTFSSTTSSTGVTCVICQSDIPERVITDELEHVRNKKIPLINQLQYQTERSQIRQLSIIQLNCSHIFHRECLVKWIHFDNTTCPLCREPIKLPGIDKITWKLNNIAVRTKCSPESIKLGLKPDGWYNIQLQIEPPQGRKIKHVRYIFHPAFSLNKLDIDQPPFDLVMKLVSNSVTVVVEAVTDDDRSFTFVHQLCKDMCSRVYYEDMYNGTDDSAEIKSLEYFKGQLATYNRADDYYTKEMPPPPRFQNREHKKGKGIMRRLFGGIFQG